MPSERPQGRAAPGPPPERGGQSGGATFARDATPDAASGEGLEVDWGAPQNVGAIMTTRGGGVSVGPWASFNLGTAVGDDLGAVAENRRRFAARIGARPVWLRQVHGRRVVRLTAAMAGADPPEADAAWTDESGLACTVQVADCLPVLLAAVDGRAVAAAHAGWRGLAAGVVEAAIEALCSGAGCTPDRIVAWLGPAIGPRRFEVGAEVLRAFGADPDEGSALFVARRAADGSPRWLADLAGLARLRLARAGVGRVDGGRWCTVADRARFFSYRRDGVTGRLAAAVWLRG